MRCSPQAITLPRCSITAIGRRCRCLGRRRSLTDSWTGRERGVGGWRPTGSWSYRATCSGSVTAVDRYDRRSGRYRFRGGGLVVSHDPDQASHRCDADSQRRDPRPLCSMGPTRSAFRGCGALSHRRDSRRGCDLSDGSCRGPSHACHLSCGGRRSQVRWRWRRTRSGHRAPCGSVRGPQ